MLKDAGIIGVGSYLPSGIVTNEYWADTCGISAKTIEKLTGIKERRFLIPEMKMPDMAYEAGKSVLEHANVDLSEIDFVIL